MCATKTEVLDKLSSAHDVLSRIYLKPQTADIAQWSGVGDMAVQMLMREVRETEEKDWEE